MRTLLLRGLVFLGCLAVVGAAMPKNDNNRNFFAHLAGDEEVPSWETRAVGQAVFRMSKDGTELEYKLIVCAYAKNGV